jgi:hypothetical protein
MKTTALRRPAHARRAKTPDIKLRQIRRASHAPGRRAPSGVAASWTLSGGRPVLTWRVLGGATSTTIDRSEALMSESDEGPSKRPGAHSRFAVTR